MPKPPQFESLTQELAYGLSRSKAEHVAIKLVHLREVVGATNVRDYCAQQYDDDYLDGDFEESVQIIDGQRFERTRNVLVDRQKLLDYCTKLGQTPGASIRKPAAEEKPFNRGAAENTEKTAKSS